MLVAYSDSESEDQKAPRAKKRKVESKPSKPHGTNASPPPPPSSFQSLYSTNVRGAVADDPALHGGRKRQVAHVEGNWPTHAYLEWKPSKDAVSKLEEAIDTCQKTVPQGTAIHSFLRSSLNVPLPLHISLSAPLVLKTEQKDDFAAAVTTEVSKCGAQAFVTRPSSLGWVSNFDATRSFLVLKLDRPKNNDLNKLLHACNTCAQRHGLNQLYQFEDAKKEAVTDGDQDRIQDMTSAFHISIAWTHEREDQQGLSAPKANLLKELQDIDIELDTVKVKIGNVVIDLELPK